jgi:hypothetical protein
VAYSRFKTVSFGAAYAGLLTVGYTLYFADGSLAQARVSAGVIDFGGGGYGATVAFPSGFTGLIKWDTGDAVPPSATATEAINPVDEEISSQPSSPASGLVQKTLYLRRQVDGLPADVTSVALADPTGTYGVRRADTGALVIASGVAMAHASTGVYTFTDPLLSPTVAYQWYAKITNTDGSVEYEPYTSPAASTHYGSRAGSESIFGAANLATWADKDSNGDAAAIAAAIDAMQTVFDNEIIARAADLRAPLPLPGDAQYSRLVTYEDTAVGVALYGGRGRDPKEPKNDYDSLLAAADRGLTAALLANRALRGVTGTWETAPAAIASGTNVAAADRWGNQPYLWGWGAWWPGVWG